MGVRLAWAAAVCLVVTWVATRGVAAARLLRLARAETPAATRPAEPAGAGLQARVAALEERLLADRARVRFWLEMQRRHEGVTAVTCSNLAAHYEAMAHAGDLPRAAEPKRRRLAVARLRTHAE